MPAAKTKAALREATVKEYNRLVALIDGISPEVAMRKREDDTSIKDVIAHRAHWIGLFQGWYSDGQAGREVYFPAKGYKWSELKAYNVALRAQQSGLDWDAARAALATTHDALVAFIDGCSEAALYGGPMKGAQNDWTTGRWAEAAGSSHYRSAAKWIRACLRADRETGAA